MPKTLFEKIWDAHVVKTFPDGTVLLYIDRQLVHEVTSAQAFEGMRLAGRKFRRPELTFATMDHNIPTEDRFNIKDAIAKTQVEVLRKNCKEFGVTLFDVSGDKNGVVHIIAVRASTPRANFIAMSIAVSQPPLMVKRHEPKVASCGMRS